MATSTTKLTLFHPIRLARTTRFARPSLKMCTISLRSVQGGDAQHRGEQPRDGEFNLGVRQGELLQPIHF